MGERGIAWVSRRPGFGALAVTRDDRVAWTPLVDALLLTHAPGRGDVA